jgi:phenylacetate-CoA ligase
VSSYLTPDEQRKLARDFPWGDGFLDRYRGMSRDALRDLQERRFMDVVDLAWRTPFYQRSWGAAGIEPGDIRGLDDLGRLPMIDK